MFCPLCKAEYREGFTECSSCSTALVADDAPESERNPPRLKWVTTDRSASDRVFADLREAGIPCSEDAKAEYWVYAFRAKRPQFAIYIFARDAEKARIASGMEFGPLHPKPTVPALDPGVPKQSCPACATEFAAGTSRCPNCGADLLGWQPSGSAEQAVSVDDTTDADLADDGSNGDNSEIVWRGGDPVTFSRVLEILREDQILHYAHQTSDHFAFAEAMPCPKLHVRVPVADAARAVQLLQELQDPFPLVAEEPPAGERPEIAPSEGATQEGATAADAPEVLAEAEYFYKRKTRLRWGLGLLVLTGVLVTWVVGTGPPSYVSFDAHLARMGGLQQMSFMFLLGSALVANVAGVGLLLAAWAKKADKVGLLSLFLALKGLLLLSQFAFIVGL